MVPNLDAIVSSDRSVKWKWPGIKCNEQYRNTRQKNIYRDGGFTPGFMTDLVYSSNDLAGENCALVANGQNSSTVKLKSTKYSVKPQ